MTVTIVRKTWKALKEGGTLVTAASLNRIEQALQDLADAVNGFGENTGGGTGGGGLSAASMLAIDAAFAKLDMRIPEAVVFAGMGDSIGDEANEWFEGGGRKIAPIWPERKAGVFSWDVAGERLRAWAEFQTGSGGGTTPTAPGGGSDSNVGTMQTIVADNFARGTLDAPVELVGSKGQAGGTWGGSGGRFTTRGDILQIAAGNTVPDSREQVILPASTHNGTDGTASITFRVATNSATEVETLWIPFAISNQDYRGLGMRLAGMRDAHYVQVGFWAADGTFTVLGEMSKDTLMDNRTDQFTWLTLSVSGKSVTARVVNQTSSTDTSQTFVLSDEQFARLVGWNYTRIGTTDLRFRAVTLNGKGLVGSTAGSTTSGTTTQAAATDASLPPFEFYNGCAAGMTGSYQRSRLAKIYPKRPDILFYSHMMNYEDMSGPDFIAQIKLDLAEFHGLYPGVPVVFLSSNPRFTIGTVPATRAPAQLGRARAVRKFAKENGYGYIGTFELFAAKSDGGQSLMVDDKHPGTEGRGMYSDAFKRWVVQQTYRLVA
jgi:hypothetical protein